MSLSNWCWNCNQQVATIDCGRVVNDLNNEPHAGSDDTNDQNEENVTTITSTTRNELDDNGMETWSKLSLLNNDVDFDPLLCKLSEKITQNSLQTMRQSWIS